MSTKIHSLNIWMVISAVLFLILLVSGILYIYTSKTKKSPDEKDLYVAEINKFMVLPKDTPVLTVIDDIAKFQARDPQYFKQAKSGDVLLGFRSLSILYEPKLKKILNIASVFRLPPPPPITPLRISLRYNGKEEERAKALKLQLEEVSPNYQIVEVTTSKATYTADVVYMVNSNREEDIGFLARVIGNSPILEKPEENEIISPNIDVIIAFRKSSAPTRGAE